MIKDDRASDKKLLVIRDDQYYDLGSSDKTKNNSCIEEYKRTQ